VVFTALFSCSKKDTSVPVSGVSLSEIEYNIEVDGQLTLLATVIPANAVNRTVIWTSDAPDVAKVELILNENGIPVGSVTALKVGKANIIVTTTSGKKIAKCAITVVAKKILVDKIEIKSENDYVYKGSTLQLETVINPANATDKKIIWSSTDPNVANIDENGLVLGVGVGTTEIQAKIGKCITTCNISVRIHVESVLIEPKTGSVLVGKTLKIKASVLPDGATDKTLIWKSFSSSSASVDKDGVVTGLRADHGVKITASSKDGGKEAVFIIDIAAPIEITNPAFKARLLELGVDKDKDGSINTYEASLITKLELHSDKDDDYSEISNLDGIEYFINLETLICQKTRLEYLELESENSENSSLGNPKLKVLDLKGSTFVKTLSCINLQLTNLKITGLNDLEKLECIGNLSPDFVINEGEPAIVAGPPTDNEIHGFSNLTSINFSSCSAIKRLVIENNGVTKLNLKDCSNLEIFECVYNSKLTSLDLSDCTKLINLNVSRNKLSSLTLGECNNLIELDCRYNKFTEIDISKCPNITSFGCDNPDNKNDEALLKTVYVWSSFVKGNLKICKIPNNVTIIKR
jgi:uncharacterized protein YjdB